MILLTEHGRWLMGRKLLLLRSRKRQQPCALRGVGLFDKSDDLVVVSRRWHDGEHASELARAFMIQDRGVAVTLCPSDGESQLDVVFKPFDVTLPIIDQRWVDVLDVGPNGFRIRLDQACAEFIRNCQVATAIFRSEENLEQSPVKRFTCLSGKDRI